jgi:AcrR family transcriptional regulator
MSSTIQSEFVANPDELDARELLLQAASKVMTRSGSVNVSLQTIAREAKVTAPLVKYYFGSKEGLLMALARKDTEHSLRQLMQLLSLDATPQEKLRIHITGVIMAYARHPYLNGLLNLLLRDSKSVTAKEIRKSFIEPLRHAQRLIIEEGIRSGRLKNINPDLAYFVIIGACHYFFSNRNDLEDRDAHATTELASSYAKTVVELILKGFLT